MKKVALLIISLYQMLASPVLKVIFGTSAMCRFDETCSSYAKRVIVEEGIIKGVYLSSVRILKCQPFYKGSLEREKYI